MAITREQVEAALGAQLQEMGIEVSQEAAANGVIIISSSYSWIIEVPKESSGDQFAKCLWSEIALALKQLRNRVLHDGDVAIVEYTQADSAAAAPERSQR